MTIICGHRGASGHTPENTLLAFRSAAELGATWIEFDVQLTSDGVPVIFHDDTLERTAVPASPLRPDQLTLEEIKAFDAGSWLNSEFAGEQIPTLDEVLAEFGGSLGLNIEIKSKIGVNPGNQIEQKVLDAVYRYNLHDKVIISSFDPFRLLKTRQLDSNIKLGALYVNQPEHYPPNFDPFQMAHSFGAQALHPPHQIIDQTLMERAKSENLQVNTWTVNEPGDMARLLDLGVNMIITNYPDRLANLISKG